MYSSLTVTLMHGSLIEVQTHNTKQILPQIKDTSAFLYFVNNFTF